MLTLGIDTATQQVGCAVGGHEGVLASCHSTRSRQHAENLAPAIRFVCEQARVELGDIGVVAVDCGPGLFTGLRVGVATAKAIATALRVPMIGLPSLDLLAFPVRYTNRLIASVVDARRGEVFSALYRAVPGGLQRLSEHQVGSPEDLTGELLARGEDCLVVGDGARRYAEQFQELGNVEVAEPGLAYPLASSLVQLAHARALREEWAQPWELRPMYLRRPDAEIHWERRRVAP